MSSQVATISDRTYSSKSILKSSLLLGVGFSTLLLSSNALAQDSDIDEVVATGTRQVIQDSINLKRENTQIVDGLSAEEIGDIPALSIGEALENLTGASSHIENGGATEISIRGLGPFLSSTVFNGRAATNGGGDRSVNFSQFPSELLSKVAIYKTQNASLVEGGVAGQIHLDTVRPLDFGKQRIQGEIKGNINPDQLNINDSQAGNIGYRGTLSYIDQFELPSGASWGLSIGGQISDISQPEQEIRSTSPQSSSNIACLVNPQRADNSNTGFNNNASTDDDCEDNPAGSGTNGGFITTIDPLTGRAIDNGEEFAFVVSQRGFRQNDTSDKREAIFGALQFQPNDRWDINLDVQYSTRANREDRYDLTFDNSRRNSRDVTIGGVDTSTLDSLVLSDTGAIQSITYETDIALAGEQFIREEEYIGGGINVEYQVNDRLTADLDLSYSRTNRTELQTSSRVQSNNRQNVTYTIENGFPQYIIDTSNNFNLNDAGGFETNGERFFDDGIRLRVDNDLDRTNEIFAGRLDFDYDVSSDFISSVEVGGRYSELSYTDILAGGAQGDPFRQTFSLSDADPSIYGCETPFAETNFLDSLYGNNNIFTYVDANGVVSTSNNFTTLDNACFASAVLAGNDITSDGTIDGIDFPELELNVNSVDVTEETLAGYIQANFESSYQGLPVNGNIGVRVVNTDVTSLGYRSGFNIATIVTDPNDPTQDRFELQETGELEVREAGGSYTEVLPSLNVNVELRDDIILRGAAFKGISRIDPSDLNFIRNLGGNVDDGEEFTNLEDILNPTASGTPNAGAFTSWNFDSAIEWYPNADSILTFGAYYKSFKGGFERVETTEDFTVGGETLTLPIIVSEVTEEQSDLYGFEITAAHRFSYLPGYLSGFGVKGGYNYAESNFEFEDSDYGDQFTRIDGQLVQTAEGIVDPAGIQGLSNHVLNAQLYYQIGDFDVSGIYKYRSEYFQPFTGDGTVLRYTQGRGLVDVRAAYKINSNFRVTLDVLNILGEERVDTFRTTDNFGQASAYGPRIFFGLRGKF